MYSLSGEVMFFLLSRLLGSLDFVFFCGQSGISSFVVVFLFAQP